MYSSLCDVKRPSQDKSDPFFPMAPFPAPHSAAVNRQNREGLRERD